MTSIQEKVRKGLVLVSDGAWGTLLQQKGLLAGECPEAWNISRPDEVFEIARMYIDAGADMVETNSFGGSSFKLAAYGFAGRVEELNRKAAELSRRAAGAHKHVLGSIGPTGKLIMMGEVTPEELYVAFREQAIALHKGGADALVVETMSDIDEAKAAVKACRENTPCEVICTMTFEATAPDEFYTMMGVSPAQMAEEMVAAGAHIVGANCGNGMEGMIGIVKQIRSMNSTIPILIHANAGLPIYRDGGTHFPETPEIMAGYVKQLIDAGANIIGGCCGTTPEHIQRMAALVRLSQTL